MRIKKLMNLLMAVSNIFKFYKNKKFLYFLAIFGVFLILFGIAILLIFSGFMTKKETEKLAPSISKWSSPKTQNPMIRVNSLLNQMPKFSEIKCSEIINGNQNESEKAKEWIFPNFEFVWNQIENSENKCQTFKESFVFVDQPLSEEEAEFPLAYGALVYKDVTQVSFLLSSIYRPNNVYVFMVDLKADKKFKQRISLFEQCFTNVFVKVTENEVEYGGYEITKAVLQSVKILVESKFDWKYFQYLTGFTLPLKTNLEMVRIFKELNGTFNVEIGTYQESRLNWDRSPLYTFLKNVRMADGFFSIFKRLKSEAIPELKKAKDSPLPLFLSNLAATFSRESAEFIVKSKKVDEVLNFLEDTEVSDESIWGTFSGNPDLLPIPGGINGSVMVKRGGKINDYLNVEETLSKNNYTFIPTNYYISRYHIWINNPLFCKGKFVKESCVFGVRDLLNLITRPELVVHKMYFNFEPAAYFCLYKHHWQRTLNFQD